MWQQRRAAMMVVVCGVVAVMTAGCASDVGGSGAERGGRVASGTRAGGADSARGAVVDEGASFEPAARASALPSLAAEMRSQGARKATTLETRLGIRVEEVTKGTAPAWWAAAANDRTRFTGTGSERELEKAYEQAVTRAGAIAANPVDSGVSAIDPRVLAPERVAWTRLVTGEYAVWAVMVPPGVPRMVAEAPPAAVPLNGSPATGVGAGVQSALPVTAETGGSSVPVAVSTPAAPVVSTPTEVVDPNRDPQAPAWWRSEPLFAGGRMTVGTRAEGENGKIASKLAVAEARRTLTAALGVEAKDVITLRSSTVELQDGRVRSYVLVSARK